jgi:hypothetical protein
MYSLIQIINIGALVIIAFLCSFFHTFIHSVFIFFAADDQDSHFIGHPPDYSAS